LADLREDLWTLAPYARQLLFPHRPPPARPWSATLEDPRMGTVRVSGDLRVPRGARELFLVVHGLGGTARSHYCLRAAAAVAQRGQASLCLQLRGADRGGDDFYNVALRADLEAALASPELAPFERLFVVGYSMGGYVALHHARGPLDPRVAAVAALCTPLDLASAQKYIDSPRAWLYRRHVLDGLKSIYRAVVARGRPVPTPLAQVLAVRTIHEWDRIAIAPRYGYDSPEHYYSALSIAPHLERLAVPALLVAGLGDPIIPASTIRPFLPAPERNGHLTVRWVPRGGHVSFSRALDLGFGPGLGLESQVFQWFERVAAP